VLALTTLEIALAHALEPVALLFRRLQPLAKVLRLGPKPARLLERDLLVIFAAGISTVPAWGVPVCSVAAWAPFSCVVCSSAIPRAYRRRDGSPVSGAPKELPNYGSSSWWLGVTAARASSPKPM
jgi:hypothetical protein